VRDVLNSSIDMMITFDFQGHVIEFNKVAEQVFGLNRKAAKKRSMLTLLSDPDDGSILLDGDPEAVYKHEKIDFLDENGKSFGREIVLTPLHDSTGKTKGRLLVARSD